MRSGLGGSHQSGNGVKNNVFFYWQLDLNNIYLYAVDLFSWVGNILVVTNELFGGSSRTGLNGNRDNVP